MNDADTPRKQDSGNERGRNLHAIEVFEMPLNIPRRQGTGIQRQHLVIKTL
jgi:hypothetical protein